MKTILRYYNFEMQPLDLGITVLVDSMHDRQVLFGIDLIQSLLKGATAGGRCAGRQESKNGALGERKGNQGVNLDTCYHESMAKK